MERNTSVRYPGGRGAVWGYVAFLAGFAANYLLVSSRMSAFSSAASVSTNTSTYTLAELTAETTVPAWKLAGLAFFNSHLVDAIFSGFMGIAEQSGKTNLLLSAGGQFRVLVAVTPLLLVASGALVTRNATKTTDLRFTFWTGRTRYFFNGGFITFLGYLPPIIVASLLVSASLDGKIVARVDLFTSWTVAGVVYPFVFGGLGGYLRSYVD